MFTRVSFSGSGAAAGRLNRRIFRRLTPHLRPLLPPPAAAPRTRVILLRPLENSPLLLVGDAGARVLDYDLAVQPLPLLGDIEADVDRQRPLRVLDRVADTGVCEPSFRITSSSHWHESSSSPGFPMALAMHRPSSLPAKSAGQRMAPASSCE